jgi:4-amino-4-deoxy-L-arabinose transferase-like glycosyltransferase
VHAARTLHYPQYDERQVSEQFTSLFKLTKFGQDNQHLLATSVPSRGARPSFDEAAPDRPSTLGNHVAQHPPLYYAALAPFSAIGRHLAFDQEELLLRLVSALMVVPLPLLAFVTARRLNAGTTVAVAAATAVLVSPEFVMTSAILNNDNLLRLLFGVVTVLMVYAWTGDVSMRTAVLIGVVSGLAMLTKGFGLALIPWTALAYTVAWRRGAPRRDALRGAATAIALGVAIGGWWWVRNVIAYGKVQPRIVTHPDAGAGFEPSLFEWARSFVTTILRLLFGWPYAPRLAVGALFVAVSIVMILALPGLRAWGRTWVDAAMLLAPVAGTVAIMAIGSIPSYYRTGLIGAAEGRYLVTSITALAALAAAGAAVAFGSRRRWLPLTGLGLGLVFQVAQFGRLLDRNYGHTGASLGDQLSALRAWLPVAPAVLVAVVVLIAAVGVGAARSLRFDDESGATVRLPLQRALPVTAALAALGLGLMTRAVFSGHRVTGVGYAPILLGLALLLGVVAVDTVRAER